MKKSAYGKSNASFVEAVMDSLNAGIYVLDRELRISWINSRGLAWSNRTKASHLKGKRCYSVLFGRHDPCADCPVLKAFETGKAEYREIGREKEGEHLFFSLSATPLEREADGSVSSVIQMVQNITAKKRIEHDYSRINKLNKTIVEKAPIAITTLDKDGVFTSVNPAMTLSIGLGAHDTDKIVGFRWLENAYTIDSGLADYIKKGLEGKPFVVKEFPFITFKGDKNIYLDLQGIPIRGENGELEYLLCITEDVTERVKTRAQLIHEAKMSTIAKLAMGVAHGLNNPLATISANSELARELKRSFAGSQPSEEDLEEFDYYLETIQEEAFRCKKIIKSLLKFTTSKVHENETIDLVKLIDELFKLTNFEKLNIKVLKKIHHDLPLIKGNLNEIRQAFWNVITNAIDAVETRKNGRIGIRAVPLAGNRVLVEVEDNGEGIPENMKDNIFEPFFTTKMPEKNTGLGLTLSYEFIKKAGGTIEVENKGGRGTIFRITLPSSSED